MNMFLWVSSLVTVFSGSSEDAIGSRNHMPQNSTFSVLDKHIQVFTTAANTSLRLTHTQDLNFESSKQPLESDISVFVNPEVKFQRFLGIGGAITDASAEVFATLSESKQEELIQKYFDVQSGIGYSLLRTTIHSCDFSPKSYTYVTNKDKDLNTFSIEHDREFRIPMIQKAKKAAQDEITIYASPWSPPAFMKGRVDMLRGGSLLPKFYQSWALYFCKFIQAYEKEGIPLWGITIQNEPMAVQRWESCIFTAAEERDFLKNFLGPTLAKNGLGDKKIVVWDHNRDLISDRANMIFGDPEAAKYAWGIGFHWYETWSGGMPMYENLKRVKESYPDKKLLFTEGCNEKFDAAKLQYWPNAERYGNSIINDLNCGTVGWTDWNVLLDENGGPNHVGNYCFAPVHANIRTGEIIYTPSYYYIGHFSKFIRPNAIRVSTATSRSDLLATSFLNENGNMVTVILNQTDRKIQYTLYVGRYGAKVDLLPHAIQTLVY